jgi:hypothetical protein
MSIRCRAPSVAALALSLALLIAGGCDQLLKSSGDPLDDLVGSWYATSFLLVNPSNSAQQIEEVAQGLLMTLVIIEDGQYTAVFVRPEEDTEVDSGTISATETELMITPSGDSPMHLTWSLNGEVFTIVNPNDHFDWDDDGDDETATLTIILHRSATNPVLNDLLGAWSATSMRFTNLANLSQQVDMVTAGGYFTMKVATGGMLSAVVGMPGDEEVGGVRTGTVVLTGDSLLVTLPGESSKMGWSLVGGVLTLSMSPNYFDFNGDGSGEAARMEMVLIRVTEPALNALNGTWVVEEMEYVNPFNSTQTWDVSTGLAAMTVELSGGVIDVYQLSLGDDTGVQHGTYSLFGDLLIADFEGDSEPSAVKVALSDGLLRFQSVSDHHDWDEDGEDEPAVMYATSSEYSGPGVGDLTGFWTMIDARIVNPVDPEQTFDILADGGVLTFGILAGGDTRRVFAIRSQNQYSDNDFILENHGPVMEFHLPTQDSGFQAFRIEEGHFFLTSFILCDWDQDGNYSEPGIRIMELEPITDVASTADLDTTWSASAMVYGRSPGWTESIDIIPVGGAYELDLHTDLTYTGSKTLLGEDPVVHTGQWEVFGNLLILHDEVAMDLKVLKYDLGGEGDLTLWRYVDHYDFDDDGTDEPAVTEIHLHIPAPGH